MSVLALCGGAVVLPSHVAAQTRPDSAAVLLETARRFEAQGRPDIADALYEMILQRFAGTPAAEEVRRITASLPSERGTRGGEVELQVWSTLYGLWLGVGLPLWMDADGSEPYGLGLLVGGPTGFLIARSYARSRIAVVAAAWKAPHCFGSSAVACSSTHQRSRRRW